MKRFLRYLGSVGAWIYGEHIKDRREGNRFIYETMIANRTHLNQIILTVSIASLTAVAALNNEVFEPFPELSFAVIAIFVLVILFSTVNLYISGKALRAIQQAYKKDFFFSLRKENQEYRYNHQTLQKALNNLVLYGFCVGLVALLILLGCYILGEVQ